MPLDGFRGAGMFFTYRMVGHNFWQPWEFYPSVAQKVLSAISALV